MYKISKWAQRSPEWLKLIFITSTDIAAIVGHKIKYKADDSDPIELILTKFKTRSRTGISINWHMERGIRCEPMVRERMAKSLTLIWQKPVTIKEVGVAVSIKYPCLATSIDGVIYMDDIDTGYGVEIKCPYQMYPGIIQYLNLSPVEQSKSRAENMKHILRDHYDQIQWHCAIMDRRGCFYGVYIDKTDELFTQYIPRNDEYIGWLIDKAMEFVNHHKLVASPIDQI